MGNEHGGEATANGLNTYAFLRYVMSQLPLINVTDKISLLGLLPHRVDPKMLNSNFCH